MADGKVALLPLEEKELFAPPHPLLLEGGGRLGPVTVAYRTYGTYTPGRPNAVFVAHALTGDARVSEPDRSGWWARVVGPGGLIDTDRYFVISANVLGGCAGTTGPASTDPATGRPFGSRFPVVTVRDMVRVHVELLHSLGIPRLKAVVGGSMGGLQALEWAVLYPDMMDAVVAIAASGRYHAQGIAWNAVQRQAILSDPFFQGGDYYDGPPPHQGLALARMLAMITYRSERSMEQQFGRRVRGPSDVQSDPDILFEVDSYLRHHGERITRRFDANSYLALIRAVDLFDLGRGFTSYAQALSRIRSRLLLVGISSDFLFPPHHVRDLWEQLRRLGKEAYYAEMDSPWGHDAFLVDSHLLAPYLPRFLAGEPPAGGWATERDLSL